ncbi:MAG TPA: amidase [Vicinamibacterales bacterium]|nr:amidase [Vicinamibacterales bacterium]
MSERLQEFGTGMSVPTWLEMAKADAERRGLEPLVSLLDGLGASIASLRAAANQPDAVDADHPEREFAVFPHSGDSSEGELRGLAHIAAQIRAGRLTSERLVEDCLARIAELQPTLNAFVTVTADEALAAARAADRRAAGGRPLGPLHGVPISLKDLIDQAGVPTTASSLVRRDHRAERDAPVTARLRQAGAVFVGKTNLHEFAFGTTSDDSGFGPARHPLDPSRSPGGSSGGSAISVATGMALASVGTDTGGSIRIPAAACGIVGLKPEWGEIPAAGVVPLSRQLDHVGPMTRSVADAWLLYDVMRGATHEGVPRGASVRGVRIGVPRGYLFDRAHEDVEACVLEAVERLGAAGAHVMDVDIPHIADTVHVYLALVLADAAEYHAATLDARPQDYTPNVRYRLEMGRYVMAEDYVRARRLRDRLVRAVDHALAGVDVLAAPALAIPAPPIGVATVTVKGGSDVVRSAMLRNTQLFNLSRHPAISVPCGATRDGWPVGLQLIGHRRGTARLLHDALAAEAVLARA